MSNKDKMKRALYVILSGWLCACGQSQDSKHQRWNELLDSQSVDYQIIRTEKLKAFKEQIIKEGNTPEGKERLKRVKDILPRTQAILNFLDTMRKKIDNTAKTKINKILLGQKKDGLAYQLQQKIKTYQNWLKQEFADFGISNDDFRLIAIDKQALSIDQPTPLDDVGFVLANFSQLSKNELLSNLTRIRTQILQNEELVLKKLGVGEFYKPIICNFGPYLYAIDYADTIKINEDYRALMFTNNLFNSSNTFATQIEMIFRSKPIDLKERNYGIIQFQAEGQGAQTWEAILKYQNEEKGIDTNFRISQKYYVIPK
jgi:ABC-type phosphate/phosphonate transport system substrate-binding protein